MSSYTYLGLDLGTQSVKGVLADAQGVVHARAQVNRPPRFPQDGWVEMDAELDWWAPAAEVIRALLADRAERAREVLAVGVCGLVPCLCPLDGAGQPLRPAILYSDNRALEDLARIPPRLDLTAEALTPKLLWLKRREPQVYAAARRVLSAHNYVVYRLTGRMCVDYDTASIFGGIFDPHTKTWDRRRAGGTGAAGRALAGSAARHRRRGRGERRRGAADRPAGGDAGSGRHGRHLRQHRGLRRGRAWRRDDLRRHVGAADADPAPAARTR